MAPLGIVEIFMLRTTLFIVWIVIKVISKAFNR
jgi:hypothetical protein